MLAPFEKIRDLTSPDVTLWLSLEYEMVCKYFYAPVAEFHQYIPNLQGGHSRDLALISLNDK